MSANSDISRLSIRLHASALISHMSAHIPHIRTHICTMSELTFAMLEQRIIMSAHMRHMSAQDIIIMLICMAGSLWISMQRDSICSHMSWHLLHVSMHCCISALICRVIREPPTIFDPIEGRTRARKRAPVSAPRSSAYS
ncbi:hypothetical protein AB0L88_29655 [Saccharopolyspora shandongensis]|uniref:hypothetical protein n=1 Tax=Saccharopolyspora shandongensis TaxID=418495 RepID=UPI0015A732B7|nr:hypothetical protein [Saccharopolyspora shandongensis]